MNSYRGWICPLCGRGVNPELETCPCGDCAGWAIDADGDVMYTERDCGAPAGEEIYEVEATEEFNAIINGTAPIGAVGAGNG